MMVLLLLLWRSAATKSSLLLLKFRLGPGKKASHPFDHIEEKVFEETLPDHYKMSDDLSNYESCSLIVLKWHIWHSQLLFSLFLHLSVWRKQTVVIILPAQTMQQKKWKSLKIAINLRVWSPKTLVISWSLINPTNSIGPGVFTSWAKPDPQWKYGAHWPMAKAPDTPTEPNQTNGSILAS